jgi:uncharacterized protein (TIGR04255 family)
MMDAKMVPARQGSGLPDFEHPPVTEVVIGLQFDALPGLSSAWIGELWSAFRDRYPITVDQPHSNH